jgi:hypothetical protein
MVPDRASDPDLEGDRVSPVPELPPVVSARDALLAFGLALAGRSPAELNAPAPRKRRKPRPRQRSGVVALDGREAHAAGDRPATAPPRPSCEWAPSHATYRRGGHRWQA